MTKLKQIAPYLLLGILSIAITFFYLSPIGGGGVDIQTDEVSTFILILQIIISAAMNYGIYLLIHLILKKDSI